MPATPTKTAIIGTFLNSRSLQNDFLQVQDPASGNIFAWIDYTGTFQGAFAGQGGGTGIQFVATLPATCFPGSTPSVQLSVAPFLIYYCSASNTWSPVSSSGGSTTPNHLVFASGSNIFSDVAGSSVSVGTGAISLTAGADTTTPLVVAGVTSQTATLLDVNNQSSGGGGTGTLAAPLVVEGKGYGVYNPAGISAVVAFQKESNATAGTVLVITNKQAVASSSRTSTLQLDVSDLGIASIFGGNAVGDGSGNYNGILFDANASLIGAASQAGALGIALSLTADGQAGFTIWRPLGTAGPSANNMFNIAIGTLGFPLAGFDSGGAPGTQANVNLFFSGITSGTAKIGVAAVAGTPNTLLLPTTTGSPGQFLQTNGANPQQLAWASAPELICFVTMALTTGTIGSATRATNTASCSGLNALTDTISCSFNGDTNATVGYAPSVSGGLTLKVWASTNTVNVDQVNNTNASITPGSATLNCRVLR